MLDRIGAHDDITTVLEMSTPILGISSDDQHRVVIADYKDPGFQIMDYSPGYWGIPSFVGLASSAGEWGGTRVNLWEPEEWAHTPPRASMGQLIDDTLAYSQVLGKFVNYIDLRNGTRLTDTGPTRGFIDSFKQFGEHLVTIETDLIGASQHLRMYEIEDGWGDRNELDLVLEIGLGRELRARNSTYREIGASTFFYGIERVEDDTLDTDTLLLVTDARAPVPHGIYAVPFAEDMFGVPELIPQTAGVTGNGLARVQDGILVSQYGYNRQHLSLGKQSTVQLLPWAR